MKPGEARLQRSTMRGSRVMPGGIFATTGNATTTRLIKETQTEQKLAMSDTEALRRHTAHDTGISPSSSENNEKMRSLEAELNTQTAKARDAGSQIQLLRDEVAKLRKENAALQQRCAALEEGNKHAQAAAAAAQVLQAAPAPTAPTDNKEHVAELTGELEKARVTIAELEARVSERANLLSTLDTLENRFDEVSRDKEQLARRVKELEKEKHRVKKKGSREEKREETNLEGKTKEKHATFSHGGSATANSVDVLAARNAELGMPNPRYICIALTQLQNKSLRRTKRRSFCACAQTHSVRTLHCGRSNFDAIDTKFPVKEFRNRCKRSGFLTKLSKNGKKWKKRFFILKDNYLFYWKSNKARRYAPLS